jgi:hypothetical protein
MMGSLDGKVFCLSGPIDNAADDGVGHRKLFKRLMTEAGIQASYLDPTDKPVGGHKEIGEEKKRCFELRQSRKFKELSEIVKLFRNQDLGMVREADIVIVYVDPNIHMCGTYNETFLAEWLLRPRYLIIEGGLEKCPLWLFDVFELDSMFDSVEQCVERLVEINKE